ncbi:MAG: glycosyltransferase family 2 protein [Candidatus Binataceae bacterium]|jgi:glycosyltransferase involved in cell wall biosynthesis
MPTISVIINTFNEEKRLGFALRSVKQWADEMIVVDQHSTDRTIEIAHGLGARVISHRGNGKPYPPREFAVEQGSGDWILALDADEVVPPQLAHELQRISSLPDIDAAVVPRLNYWFGSPIMHSSCDPDRDACVRFFKRGRIIASSEAHKDFSIPAGARAFRIPYTPGNALVHFTYVNTEAVLTRTNRYSTLEAQQLYRDGADATLMRTTYSAGKEFLWRYFKCQGYRDGWRGLYISFAGALYRICIDAKLHELRAVGGSAEIEALYAAEALKIIGGYEAKESGSCIGQNLLAARAAEQ